MVEQEMLGKIEYVNIWAVIKSPVGGVKKDNTTVPSYIGIFISHYKDPYEQTSVYHTMSQEFWSLLKCPKPKWRPFGRMTKPPNEVSGSHTKLHEKKTW